MERTTMARVDRSNGGSDQARRIAALEGRMLVVENSVKAAVDNTAEILNILTYTRTAAGLVRKWGPRAVVFGAGIFTSLGIGNPKLIEFISHFFG